MVRVLCILSIHATFCFSYAFAQNISGVINTYVHVIAIDTCLNTATVVSSNEFAVGDRVLLIQMNGATIDTSNAASFGTIQSLGSAGLFEIGTIQSIPNFTTVRFQSKLLNEYDPVHGAVQLVRIPAYSNVTVSDTLRAKPWDPITGTGGILFLEASQSITVLAPIDVSGLGFYGGGVSANGSSGLPSVTDYVDNICTSWNGGGKGEGIARSLAYGEFCEGCRGAAANGGGGGNSHNAGGAGGANAGAGGRGGDQTDESGFGRFANGGEPGKALPLSSNRIFMGGGGGGGHQNDLGGTNGGSGGGIIILRAPKIYSDSEYIRANGTGPGIYWAGNRESEVPAIAMSDGAGGGGAGGTIWLDADSELALGGHYNALMLEADGANGGYADAGNVPISYAPGGGGGGGTIAWKHLNWGMFYTDYSGGASGLLINSTNPLTNETSYGASNGNGGSWDDTLGAPESTVLYLYPMAAQHLVSICAGDSATISAFGGDSYVWSPASQLKSPSDSSETLSPDSTTTYTVQITKANCVFTDTVQVSVLPKPLASFHGPSSTCIGSTEKYFLASQQGVSYEWHVSGGIPDTVMGDSIQVTWSTAGTGTVSVIATNGECSDSISQQINIAPSITPVIQATTVVLNNVGDTSRLSLNLPYVTYLWSTGDTTSVITIDSAGTYSVIVIDTNGCTGTDSIEINYPSTLPFIELAIPDISAKPGDEVMLPVNIVASRNLGAADVRSFTYIVHFDQSLLEPLDPGTSSVFNNGERYVTKSGTISNQLSTNSLDQIQFLAALGDAIQTGISFDTVIWSSDKPIVTKLDSGHFTLLGVCPAGGNRLFFENGTVAINGISPNPVSGIAVADYSLVEPGETSLEVLDMLGRVVLLVANGNGAAGDYHAAFDASSLPNGMYNLLLRTPTQVFTKRLEVYH